MAAVLPQTLEICVTITELPEVLVSPGRLEQATLLGLMLVMVPVVVQPVEQLTLVVQFPTPPQLLQLSPSTVAQLPSLLENP